MFAKHASEEHRNGRFTRVSQAKIDNWDARLKAADMGLTVQGAYPKKQASVQPLHRNESTPMQVLTESNLGLRKTAVETLESALNGVEMEYVQ